MLDPVGLDAEMHVGGGDRVAVEEAAEVALRLGLCLGGGGGVGGRGGAAHVLALRHQHHLPHTAHTNTTPTRRIYVLHSDISERSLTSFS